MKYPAGYFDIKHSEIHSCLTIPSQLIARYVVKFSIKACASTRSELCLFVVWGSNFVGF